MLHQLAGRPMEILLVEDGLLDAQVTLAALKHCGIHHRATLIRTVEESQRFLDRDGVFARAPVPDLVLLDLLLLDGEGTDVLRHIRNSEELRDTPVVVLTASQDETDRDECRLLEVDDFIQKPFDVEQFLRVVHEHRRLHMFGGPARV